MTTTVHDISTQLDGLPGRMASAIREQMALERAVEQEWLRGIKYMRVAAGYPTLPTSIEVPGPDQGNAWNVKLFTCTLSAADSVGIYVGTGQGGDVASPRLVGYIPPVSVTAPNQGLGVFSWSSDQLILFPGEGLFAVTTGTGHFSTSFVCAVQVPQEELGKVLY